MTERKHEILAASWVLALPSLKEGWGLVVGEAAAHRVPTLAYRSAGGTTESVSDGITGLARRMTAPSSTCCSRRLIDDVELADLTRRRRVQAGRALTPGSTRQQ